MPYTIQVGKTGNSVTFDLGPAQSFAIESLSATIDTNAMVPNSFTSCDVTYRDNAGLLIAECRSSTSLIAGVIVTMTFAPFLPDTLELGNQGVTTVCTTGLVETILPPGSSVTVTAIDAAAIVQGFNLWVEDGSAGFDDPLTLGAFMLVPGPSATQ